MELRIWNPPRELTTNQFHQILDFGLSICDKVVVVEHRGESLTSRGASTMKELQPFLIKREDLSEWPGTRIGSGTAPVSTYQFNSQTARIIKVTASSPYEWLQPNLPEDLSLLRPDGTPWFVTIAHERDCYFKLTEEEKTELSSAIPNLKLEARDGR